MCGEYGMQGTVCDMMFKVHVDMGAHEVSGR